eukprot:Lithocolla_globosa_v1_NODE_5453_length_1237_cov_5.626058.p1 type:complete len:258 gc:universal NODE_5453_length_1237_cov_5.626058:971-198(-)
MLFQPTYDAEWLPQLESTLQRQFDPRQQFPTGKEMRMMWQTPILHINIASIVGSINVPEFNSRLSSTILTEYNNFRDHNQKEKQVFSHDGTAGNDLNQAFFEWQKRGGWKKMMIQKEFKQLESFLQDSVDTFLKSIGLENEITERSREFHPWATVHERGSSHLGHTHRDCLISGVYYVKMPDFSGNILFDDPRGPLPPFDNKLTISPLLGDLVLFPSWLTHQVSPTHGTDPRISIAFNIPGKWETTVGVSEWFAVEE